MPLPLTISCSSKSRLVLPSWLILGRPGHSPEGRKRVVVIVVVYYFDTFWSYLRTHTHTTVLLLFWNMSGTTRVSRYQEGKTRKVKTNLDLLEQEIMSGSGICWATCKSAPHPRQPRQHPTTQFFTGRMPFLPPNQQHQSTEVILEVTYFHITNFCNAIVH